MKTPSVSILGSYTTKFGELWEVSPRTLAKEAVDGAIADSGLEKGDMEALFVGNMLSGILGGQEHLGAFFAEAVGLHVPAWKIEGACASGGLAMHMAFTSVLSGLYETVVVLGVEKMTDHKPEDVAVALSGAGTDEERTSGVTFPGLYAMLARVHMAKYGTTSEELASVAVKNHFHARLNAKAQFRNALTVESVLKSSMVSDPLHLLDCSPITDGASAVVISRKKVARAPKIVASVVATDSLGLAGRTTLTELSATKRASKKAYDLSGIQPKDVDVVELHDCFTIAELLALEDLSFFKKGESGKATVAGKTKLGGGSLVVNPSGGLKGCGHPVGATGVKQIAELALQLKGKAGERQVPKAAIGLAHNVGGSGGTAVVHIVVNN